MTAEQSRMTLGPNVWAGKPVIRGTRLSVAFVIGLMEDGWSEADILAHYPGMTHEDILACLAYARDTLRSESVFPSAARADIRRLVERTMKGTDFGLKLHLFDYYQIDRNRSSDGDCDPLVYARSYRLVNNLAHRMTLD